MKTPAILALLGAAMSVTAANGQALFAPGNGQTSVALSGTTFAGTTLNVFTEDVLRSANDRGARQVGSVSSRPAFHRQ